MKMIEEFSDFVVYVDESGDANLDKINQNFPAFVLTFCIFNKKEYSFQAIPKLNQVKPAASKKKEEYLILEMSVQ